MENINRNQTISSSKEALLINNHSLNFYKIAGKLFLSVLLILIFLQFLSDKLPYLEGPIIVIRFLWFPVFLSLCGIGYSVEMYLMYEGKVRRFINKLIEKKINKWLLGIFASAFVYCLHIYSSLLTNNFINEYTNVDASNLPNAVAALKVIFIPYVFIIMISTFYYFFALKMTFKYGIKMSDWKFTNLFFASNDSPAEQRVKLINSLLNMSRLFGICWLLIVLKSLEYSISKTDGTLNNYAKHIVISSEYFQYSNCDNIKEESLSAELNSGYISVYDKSEATFEVVKCLKK